MCYFLSPSAADGNAVAHALLGDGSKGAFADASSAMIAGVGVDAEFTVFDARVFDGARLLYRASLAGTASVVIDGGDPLPDDADIVEVGLDAVVGTAADGDLEFVGKLDAVVSLVKALVDLLREPEGVDQAELAGRSLAGNDGAHTRSRAARGEPVPRKKGAEGLDIGIGNSLNLEGHTRGECDLAATEALCRLCDGFHHFRRYLSVSRNDTGVEGIGGRFITKKSQPLDTGDLFGGRNDFIL